MSSKVSKDIEARQQFASRLNKSALQGNGEARTSTRGKSDEELVIKSPKITKDECSIFAFGSFRKLATSIGFLQIVCVNENGVEYKENLSDFKDDSKTRQRFIKTINRISMEDKGNAKFSINGQNYDEIIIKFSEIPRLDCSDFTNSEYGKTASSIGFMRVVCKSNSGFTVTGR